MSLDTTYHERAIVLAYADAQRPPFPHEDFRRFRRARLRALEDAYQIRMSADDASSSVKRRSLWMLFDATVESFLRLQSPRVGFLDDSLINVTIDRLGSAGLELQESEKTLHSRLHECRAAHEDLLTRLFVLLWGPIPHPITSAELRAHGFDDSKEPRRSDYFDQM